MVGIFPGFVYGKRVTIKKIEYTRYSEVGPFWLGDRYLATGFGMVQWDIEPSDVYVLAGTIINGVKYGTVVSVKTENSSLRAFDIIKNYPNPFNNLTVISYSVSSDTYVTLTVYDVLGRGIAALVNEKKQQGKYETDFRADNIPSGTYFAVMRTEYQNSSIKLLLVK